MPIFYNAHRVVDIYHRAHKVLFEYRGYNLVYQASDPYAFGGYIKSGLVLQLDCRRIDVENKTWKEEQKGIVFPLNADASFGYHNGISNATLNYNGAALDPTKSYVVEFYGFINGTEQVSLIQDTENGFFAFKDFSVGNGGSTSSYIAKKSEPIGYHLIIYDNVTLSFGDTVSYSSKCLMDQQSVEETHESSGSNKLSVFISPDAEIFSIRVYEKEKYSQRVFKNNYQKDLENFYKDAFGGYSSVGLLSQLDCRTFDSSVGWKDLITGTIYPAEKFEIDRKGFITLKEDFTTRWCEDLEICIDNNGEVETELHQDVIYTIPAGTKIYSMRIYNVHLNNRERQKNRDADVRNFGGEIPLNAVLLKGGTPLKYANGDYVKYKIQ